MNDDDVQVIYILTGFLPVLLIAERNILESPTINMRLSILALRKNILLFYLCRLARTSLQLIGVRYVKC